MVEAESPPASAEQRDQRLPEVAGGDALGKASVSGSANVPGWESWKTFSVTAYTPSVEKWRRQAPPRYAASPFMPSPTFGLSSKRLAPPASAARERGARSARAATA